MSILKIPTARIFEPLLSAARYKGLYGGRGSGKSHFFGELLVETCQAERGTLAVCIREAQRTLAQSSKRLIESKIASLGLGHRFKVDSDKIETPGDGIVIFRGMQDHTAESIKSLEGFRIAWIDEAQNLTPKQMKALVTRAGPGTKMICLGNIAQIDTPYLTETTTGLTYVVNRFHGWTYSGHITLVRGERSRLADYASEAL